VPVWPGKEGTATVDVAAIDPKYREETVVNSAGTCTTTVPVCSGRDGTATVKVTATEPEYSDETVVNGAGT
jgi:hypothetical protein